MRDGSVGRIVARSRCERFVGSVWGVMKEGRRMRSMCKVKSTRTVWFTHSDLDLVVGFRARVGFQLPKGEGRLTKARGSH